MKQSRFWKATRSEDPILKAVAISDWFQAEMRSCESGQMMKGMSMETRTERDQAFLYQLHKSADGYGLTCASKVPFIHKWVVEGLHLMLCHRYCAGIALCGGMLPTRHRSARGLENATRTCDCCGPGMEEHLGYILQVCPQTHRLRIKWHNLIVVKI